MSPQLPPPGWYADPAGVPGRTRWWDGTAWTHRTRGPGGAWGRTPWLLGGAALALVMVLLAALPSLTRPTPTSSAAPTFAPAPTATRSGPSIPAEPPSQGPRGRTDLCAGGSPSHRSSHPVVPDTVTGGGLRVGLAAGWRENQPPRLPFGSDMAGACPGPGSPAWLVVGAFRADTAEWASPLPAARTMVGCLAQLPELRGLAAVDQKPVPVTIDGTRESVALLAHLGPAEGSPTRTALVVVADTGAPESMAFVLVIGGYQGPASDTDLQGHLPRITRAR